MIVSKGIEIVDGVAKTMVEIVKDIVGYETSSMSPGPH